MFALLHQDDLWAQRQHVARGLEQVVLTGVLANLAVIHEHAVDAFDDLGEIRLGVRIADPEIHRVEPNEFWMTHLVEHVELQAGGDIRQVDVLSFTVRFG